MKNSLTIGLAALAILLVGTVGVARADLLFDFEGSVQNWSRFGGGTLDFGLAEGQGSQGAGPDGIFYVTNLNYTLYGGAVRSPNQSTWPGGQRLTDYTGFSADVQLSVDGLDPAYPGPGPNVELMLQLPGYLEFAKIVSIPADGNYYTISSDFADLVPQNLATEPITQAQLGADNLQIRVLLRNLNRVEGDPSGKIRLRVDNIQAIPEPASLMLLGLGALALVRRR
jgi:hypothetical protein